VLSWPARQIAFNVGEDGSVVAGKILALHRERGFIRAMGGIGERRNLLSCHALSCSAKRPRPKTRVLVEWL
jgi:hypothetical protein